MRPSLHPSTGSTSQWQIYRNVSLWTVCLHRSQKLPELLVMSSYSKPSNTEEGNHLRQPRLHVQLLEDCIHVTSRATIPQSHKAWTGPAVHRGKVLGKRATQRAEGAISICHRHISTIVIWDVWETDELTDISIQPCKTHVIKPIRMKHFCRH